MIYSLGDKYYVRTLQPSDIDGPYPSWFEDQEICKYNSHGKFFKNIIYYKEYIENINNSTSIVWAICHDKDGHIGNISLQNLSIINRNAELTIIIGNKNHWNKRVGYKASYRLLEHGFHKLNLYKIYCATPLQNISMINLAKQLGMTEEGTRRSHMFLDNEWCDITEFGILREEFTSDSNNCT